MLIQVPEPIVSRVRHHGESTALKATLLDRPVPALLTTTGSYDYREKVKPGTGRKAYPGNAHVLCEAGEGGRLHHPASWRLTSV